MAHGYPSRSLPAFSGIAREQLWFLGTSAARFWPFLILWLLMLGVFSRVTHPDARLMVSVLLALLLAVLAWPQQKTAGGIAYFRSLPPTHWKNASVRTAVAWFVLMILCLASFLVVDSAYRGVAPFWILAPTLMAATYTLLLLSGLFAATRYGIVWLIGPHIALTFGQKFTGWGAAEFLDPLLWGRFGVIVAITGRVGSLSTGFSITLKPMLLTSAVWLVVVVAIFLFATSRRREY